MTLRRKIRKQLAELNSTTKSGPGDQSIQRKRRVASEKLGKLLEQLKESQS